MTQSSDQSTRRLITIIDDGPTIEPCAMRACHHTCGNTHSLPSHTCHFPPRADLMCPLRYYWCDQPGDQLQSVSCGDGDTIDDWVCMNNATGQRKVLLSSSDCSDDHSPQAETALCPARFTGERASCRNDARIRTYVRYACGNNRLPRSESTHCNLTHATRAQFVHVCVCISPQALFAPSRTTGAMKKAII